MEIKNIAKNTGVLIISKIFTFFIGIVRAKLNAIYLGTAGVGITSQLQDSLYKISSVATFGMETGCTKLLSQNKLDGNNEKILSVLRAYLTLVLPLTIIVYVLGLLFSGELSMFFLGNTEYKNYFLISFALFPFIIMRTVPNSLLYAFKKINIIALSEILSGLFIFISFILLIINFNLLGAVINISIGVLISFSILLIMAYGKILKIYNISFKKIFYVKFSKIFAKELLTIGGIEMLIIYYNVFSETLSRAFIVNKIGIDSLGLYNPILAWSGLFTGFIYPSIFGYLGPRYSETKSNDEIVIITNDAIRLMTFVVIPFIFLGIASRDIILPLFYSNEFSGASEYLPLHFIGLLFGTWVYIFTIIFTPTGRVKKYIPFGIGHITFGLLIILLLTGNIGLWALAIKNFTIPVILSIILFLFFKKDIGLRLNKENIFLILYSISGSLIIYFMTHTFSIIISVILTFSLYFVLKTNEKEYIKSKIKKINIFKNHSGHS